MSYEIRLAELQDLDTIQELSVSLSEKEAEEFDSTIDAEWNKSEEATEYFRERLQEESGFALVVEGDSQVVGYAVGGIRSSKGL